MGASKKIITALHALSAKLSGKQFLIFSSVVVALWSGITAVVLKSFAHYIHKAIVLEEGVSLPNIIVYVLPLIGILITLLVIQVLFKKGFEKGSYNVLYAIAKNSSRLPKTQTYSHVLTSAITVGLGGSAGLESPIVQTGAAIGSTYSSFFPITYRDRTLLLACGAASGIAAAFNAPIAGVLFAMEVLMINASVSAFIPLLMAGAIGALCSIIMLDEEVLFSFHLKEPFDYHNVPFYILLGLLAGLISVYYIRTYIATEKKINTLLPQPWTRAVVGGSILVLLIFLIPPFFGEGYTSIRNLADLKPELLFKNSIVEGLTSNTWLMIAFILMAALLKVFATVITLSSGGNGGNFAPSLFVGGFLGFGFSHSINEIGLAQVPVANFCLVGMAGVLSGIFHAPLTGIFLIAEITGGYELMIPLMIVSAISYMVAKFMEPHSLDAEKLLQKGLAHSEDRDESILTTLATQSVIEKDFKTVSVETNLQGLIKTVAQSRRNIFPVVDNEGILKGIILLDNIREIMFNRDLYEKTAVHELMQQPPAVLDVKENMNSVMNKFDKTDAWNLPVVDEGKYVGFVSKSSIFSEYRKKLMESSLH